MHDLAIEQVGDGGEPDVGMRPDVEAVTEQELGGPHLVEEDEGADHLAASRRQRAAHLEAADVACARYDHLLDGIARQRVAKFGVFGGLPAHRAILSGRPRRADALVIARRGPLQMIQAM